MNWALGWEAVEENEGGGTKGGINPYWGVSFLCPGGQ